MTTLQKTCFKCSETKPVSEFYKHAQMGDGYLGKCKECTKRDVKTGRGDHTRAYDRERYRKNKPKHVARMAVQSATSKGIVQRPPACWYCGRDDEEIEGHHADYQEKMGVVWLCKTCHGLCHSMTTMLTKTHGYAVSLARYFS